MNLSYENASLYRKSKNIKEKLQLHQVQLEETLMSGTHRYDDISVFVCDVGSDYVTVMSCDGSNFKENNDDVVMVDIEYFLKLNNL